MKTPKLKKSTTEEDGTEKLVNSISELVELRKNSVAKKDELKFISIYKNLDRMLSQLPDEVVEDLNMEFVQLAYNAIQRNRNITVLDFDGSVS